MLCRRHKCTRKSKKMDKNTESIKPEQTESIHDESVTYQSLLSILHDKNKVIEKLQKQLHFQKLQLKHYLSKTFGSPQVEVLAKTCVPYATEDNLPVTLALNRFYRQFGFKSKIISLYERMCKIEDRVGTILQIQESVLRRLLGQVCDIVKCDGEERNIKIQFKKVIPNLDPEIFNNLLSTDVGLRENLETLRICGDRLIAIEEERNMIVEQVYTLPIEERTNCNYLIGIQVEKVQLQNHLQNVLKDQKVLQNRVEGLYVAERQLSQLQDEYKIVYKTNTDNVTQMLKKVNDEALTLISKSNDQKEKYTKEIANLKDENLKISKLLEGVKNSMDNQMINRDKLTLKSVFSAGLYRVLNKEITQVVEESEQSKNLKLEETIKENKMLKEQLQQTLDEKAEIQNELDSFKDHFVQAQKKFKQQLAELEIERNSYKSQVDDLQAIRAAYAQLAENTDPVTEEDCEFDKENEDLISEVEELRKTLDSQKSRVDQFSEVYLQISQPEKELTKGQDDTAFSDMLFDHGSPLGLKKTESCSTCQQSLDNQTIKKTDLDKHLLDKIELKKDLNMTTIQLKKLTNNVIQKLIKSPGDLNDLKSAPSLGVHCQERKNKREKLLDTNNKQYTVCYSQDEFKHPFSPEDSNKSGAIYKLPDDIKMGVSTTFEIKSSHRNGKQDLIKGVLQGRDKLQGTLKMGDMSVLNLKVNCFPSEQSFRNLEEASTDGKSDYELMKDCSTETVAYSVPPLIKETSEKFDIGESKPGSQKKGAKNLNVSYKKHQGGKSSSGKEKVCEWNSEQEAVKLKLKQISNKLDADMCAKGKTIIDNRIKSMSNLKSA